jgi:pimeloyl-ACP methyl ester carboxylesterase
MHAVYRPERPSTSEFLAVRQWRLHLRRWGVPQAGRPPLLLLHGWMDMGASWQFMVDRMAAPREILAADWRGFGLTEWAGGGPPPDHHAFDEYLADLDRLLELVSPDQPVDLVGHSMGGNVAMLFAGARPRRVRRLVNLEGFGLADVPAQEAATRHGQWLDELAALRSGAKAMAGYDSLEAVARRLRRNNPRLPQPLADWLAGEWAGPVVQGDGSTRWFIRGEAAHRVVSARVFRADETLAHYQAIQCPVLAVHAGDDTLSARGQGGHSLAEFHRRLAVVPHSRIAMVEDAGHMLHHDQPLKVAELVDNFLL